MALPPSRPLLHQSMPVHYTVLLLLRADEGDLVEIEPVLPDATPAGRSHWLWIEGNTVTALRERGTGHPGLRVFDLAVLTLDGRHAMLRWPSGRHHALAADESRELGPVARRLLHQHLN